MQSKELAKSAVYSSYVLAGSGPQAPLALTGTFLAGARTHTAACDTLLATLLLLLLPISCIGMLRSLGLALYLGCLAGLGLGLRA